MHTIFLFDFQGEVSDAGNTLNKAVTQTNYI
jgi:hypothetical protein